jgi:hypothetical protein
MTMKNAMLFTVFVLAIGLVGTSQARDRNNGYGGHSYDNQSGNSYNSYGNGYHGYNSNTGSQWNSNTYGGVTRGTDSQGNSWSYDRNSGNYYNYGTGETRHRGQKQ